MTVHLTYTVKGLEEIVRNLANTAELIGPPLRTALTKSALLVEGQAKRLVPVDTGNLRRTITHRVDRAPVPLFAEVGTNASYARTVHDGRRAGAAPPPTSALAGWASRHGIPSNRVYLVARAIGRKGIRKRPFLQVALNSLRAEIDGILGEAARDIEARWG